MSAVANWKIWVSTLRGLLAFVVSLSLLELSLFRSLKEKIFLMLMPLKDFGDEDGIVAAVDRSGVTTETLSVPFSSE